MPYYGAYRGDYSTYGYPMGDPGFLSNLWKGIKKIAPTVIGTALGGPVGGAIGSQVGRIGTPPIVATPGGQQFAPQIPAPPGGRMQPPTPPRRFGGGPGIGARPPAVMPQAGCCPPGYHLDKATGTRCVRNRRMNVANPKALRRSLRRVQGFEKLVRRTFTVSGTVKPKRGRR